MLYVKLHMLTTYFGDAQMTFDLVLEECSKIHLKSQIFAGFSINLTISQNRQFSLDVGCCKKGLTTWKFLFT